MEEKKTVIYCRVDRGGRPEMRREALDLQKQELERYAKKRGIPISGYYEDDGFSGHDLKRPGLTHLMKACHTGGFEQILVVDRTRLYQGSQWDEPQWPFQVYSLNPLEHTQTR